MFSARGFSPIIIVALIAIICSLTIIGTRTLSFKSFTTPSPTPAATIEPTPTPTESPTPFPTPTATPSPTPKPTTKPSTTPTSTAAPPAVGTAPDNGLARISVNTSRGTFTTTVLVMNNPTMFTDTGNESNCDNECIVKPLHEYATQNGAFAGVNGSYFCPDTYPDCQSKKNSFDFPVFNSRVRRWINEDKLGWNNRAMVYQDGGGFHFAKNANDYRGTPNAAITNYPALLDNGNVVVGDYTLSANQQAKGTKVGLGLNGNKVFVAIAQNVDMYDFAAVFQSLGARSALNLDTGGSTAFWHGGSYKFGPGRNLPNVVLFK